MSSETPSARPVPLDRHGRARLADVARERLGSVTTRLALFAILLASLTAGLIGTLAYTRARHALEAEARSRLALLARDVAEHLHRELDDRVADITNWAHLEIMRAVLYRDVDKEIAQFLRQIVGGRQVYRAIACLGAEGDVVAYAGESVPLGAPDRGGRPRISLVPDVADAGERSLRVEVAVPNPERPGTTIGTLLVLLERQRLLNTIESSAHPSGRQPRLTVRSRAGETILATDDRRTDPDVAVLRGIAPVGPLAGADGPELEVVAAEPERVALADVAELRMTLFRVGSLVLLLGSVVGVLVAWQISAPIRRLTAAVRGITARGRFEEPVDLPRAAGEVGMLAAAFQSMMESLAAAQNETLVQARRAFLGEIAANIAHEVRTPLSVLKTSAQLLARQELPAGEQRQLASHVAAEVDRLNGFVTSLVDLARPRPVRYRSESLADVVDRALTFFAPQATKLGVAISRAVEPSVRVHGSADQLYQVLLNAIHNALQAMAGPGQLGVRCFREDGWAVLEIQDSGPGFAPEMLARAFAPFWSTKPDGTGLGLAISKRIIEEHGGTIAVENPPRGGACVRVKLPHRPEAR